MKQEKWFLLQEWVADELKDIDPYARSTKQSGGGSEKGDVRNSCGLNCECKCYNTKSPYQEKWLAKCQEEIPLHSDKIAIVVTENCEGKKRVHIDANDFFEMFKRLWKYEN